MPPIRKHASSIAVSAATAVITAGVVTGAPAVAAGIFAKDSHKVDGFHAVGADAKVGKRAGKLVATNQDGRLPNGIIAKAPDSDLLDGLDSTSFSAADHHHDDRYSAAGHNHDDRYVRKGSAIGVEVFAVRDDGSVRNQSDPEASVTKVATGKYCFVAPGAQEGAVGTLQNMGFDNAGTIRVTMGIGGFCGDIEGARITVETFNGSAPADARFALMYPVSLQ
jgi:hypothetical protein